MPRVRAESSTHTMQYRNFGKAGFKVSDIGYGAWGIGKGMWIGADDEESLRSLNAARNAGVNFFDTALVYGDGHSEELIARAFGRDKDIIIASKVPPINYVWEVAAGSPLREHLPAGARFSEFGADPAQPGTRADRHLPIPHLA